MTTRSTARTGPVPGDPSRGIPRRAHALLAPAVFYALMRWDDMRTVDLLRERSAKARPSVGTVSP